jgi:hypothetical protein
MKQSAVNPQRWRQRITNSKKYCTEKITESQTSLRHPRNSSFFRKETIMLKIAVFILTLALSLAFVSAQNYTVVINGQVAQDKAVVINGQTYLPLSTLNSLGVTWSLDGTVLTLGTAQSTVGGANQRASVEGCLGETLFNGIWRIKVTDLVPLARDPGTIMETPGWGLTVELRNGALGTLMPVDTGVDGTGQGIQLAFADAQTLNVDPLGVQTLTFASLPQGGVVTQQLEFWYPYDTDPSTIQTPVKFLFQINPAGFEDAIKSRGGGAYYSTPSPSFRISLDCGQ